MFKKEIIAPFLCFSLFLLGHAADENVEVTCNINIKKPIQCVSEQFLSISVDPAVLLAGVNLSETSLRLAKHIGPAFIRIAGPTTQFIKYVDQEDGSHNLLSDDGNSVRITPSIWFGINEWLKLAKLTPVFGINDGETVRGLWNPKTTLPLFDISEQLNISCYWQLGYDSSDKNETRYTQDLNIFHYILGAYGGRNDSWKIIGSDISVMHADRVENIMMELNGVTEAVMWEPSGITGEQFPQKDTSFKILQRQSSKPRTKVWTTIPKSAGPVTFSAAILWAKQIGTAAKMGYDVVFRQPRIYELFTDTPIYWCSLLHKKLMGCHVLETKTSIFQEDTNVFAHCTRKQNSFVRRGALSIMVVNDHPNKYKVKVKLGNSLPEKSMEVQTYILTSNSLNSTELYLNGQLLTPEVFHHKQPFEPKIRRTKSTSHIALSLPPLSIGFFVLPGARVPVCIEKEKETRLLLEEIEEDQKMQLSDEVALQLGPRGSFVRHNLLEEITHNLKEEMMSDEKYYKKTLKHTTPESDKHDEKTEEKAGEKLNEKGRKHFIDRVKLADKHKKVFDFEKKRDYLKKFILDKSKSTKPEPKQKGKAKQLELTSEEIEALLKERAVDRAAQKNIVFTDEELDALIRKASKSFNKSRSKRSLPTQSIKRRGINIPLVEKYSRIDQNAHQYQEKHNQPVKGASAIRNRKNVRAPRAVNFNLMDLKSKIAERKRFWDDKRDELLGNSLNIKENLKDKIRELKSNLRFKRDINMDLLNENTKSNNKKDKFFSNEEIEATIRQSGQTSSDILDEFQLESVEDEGEESGNKGEIYAELADPEELEEELFHNAHKTKKHKLFDKKSKIDPFAIEHPTIDIVEPTRRRQQSKTNSKTDDKLQFLTSSEEFTDIEEDMPCIHEFFGPEYKLEKKGKRKGSVPEINEFYGFRKLKKRAVDTALDEGITHHTGDAVITMLEISEFDNKMPPIDLLQDLFIDAPVLDKPLINEMFNFQEKVFGDNLNKNAVYKMKANNTTNNESMEEEHVKISNRDEDTGGRSNNLSEKSNSSDSTEMSDSSSTSNRKQEIEELHNSSSKSSKEDLSEHESFETFLSTHLLDQDANEVDAILKPDESDDQNKSRDRKLETDIPLEKTVKKQQSFRKRRSTDEEHHTRKKAQLEKVKPIIKKDKKHNEEKKTKKSHTNHDNLNDQMHSLREKLQERKDEIDKILQKQKEMEKDMKEHWKNKLHRKKKSHLKPEKEEIKFEIEFPQLSSRFKPFKNNEAENGRRYQPNLVKRSIFNTKKSFGNYQPVTADLKLWKPSDITYLKRDVYIANPKKMVPPNDYPIFKNIFNKPYNLRKRRSIDTDADVNANSIDTYINEIKKETDDTENNFGYDYEINENKDKVNIQDNEFFKFKLPNNVEFEIIDEGENSPPVQFESPKHYDIYDFRSKSHPKNNRNEKDEITKKEPTHADTDGKNSLMDSDNDLSKIINENNINMIQTTNKHENNKSKEGNINNTDIFKDNSPINDEYQQERPVNINSDLDPEIVDSRKDTADNKYENNIERNEDNKGKEGSNNKDAIFQDGVYKFRLPNSDELKLIKNGEETEIKLVHHVQDKHRSVEDNNEEDEDFSNVGELIPDITLRSFKPIESVGQFFDSIKDFFSNIGRELQGYLKQVGIK